MEMNYPPSGPPGTTTVDLYDGYLLGTKSLDQEQSYLQDMWNKGVAYTVTTNKWTNGSWAKGIK
jgi:multiple sugar transport system substrate-binding protein